MGAYGVWLWRCGGRGWDGKAVAGEGQLLGGEGVVYCLSSTDGILDGALFEAWYNGEQWDKRQRNVGRPFSATDKGRL